MSGGSYDYAFGRVNDFADDLRRRVEIERVPRIDEYDGTVIPGMDPKTVELRLAFCDHLEKVAEAMHAIEWVDSSDYGPGDEHHPIREVLGTDEPRESLVGWAGHRE